MELVKKTVLEIVDHIRDVIEDISEKNLEKIIDMLIKSQRVFVYGVGRSGLAGKAFATRLSHLKFEVFVVGETITPAVKNGDLFVAISGSGETNSVVTSAESAKREGANIVAITSNTKSSLGKISSTTWRVGKILG